VLRVGEGYIKIDVKKLFLLYIYVM